VLNAARDKFLTVHICPAVVCRVPICAIWAQADKHFALVKAPPADIDAAVGSARKVPEVFTVVPMGLAIVLTGATAGVAVSK